MRNFVRWRVLTMKEFITEYLTNYYFDWIYLGTADKKDFYLQSLPTKENPYPSYSIVHGKKPSNYISTTFSVESILDNQEFYQILSIFISGRQDNDMLHLFAFIREYNRKQDKN
jgi:hypothetical protein